MRIEAVSPEIRVYCCEQSLVTGDNLPPVRVEWAPSKNRWSDGPLTWKGAEYREVADVHALVTDGQYHRIRREYTVPKHRSGDPYAKPWSPEVAEIVDATYFIKMQLSYDSCNPDKNWVLVSSCEFTKDGEGSAMKHLFQVVLDPPFYARRGSEIYV